MDNVEIFDSAIEAMHKVKELSMYMNYSYCKIFFAFNDYNERYYVTDDSDDLSSAINQVWCDGGMDNSPENESNNWTVWEYSDAVNKEKYPNTYKGAKRSLIDSSKPLIRRMKTVGLEYSVDFTIE